MYRHFPFIGNESWRAAEASECAAEQNRFHEYEETVYLNWNGENQGEFSDANLRVFAEMTGLFLNQYDDCMSSNKYLAKVQADFDDGTAAGVNSTPTIFLNGEIIGGLRDYGGYRVKIEQALAEVGG
ncbi:MAG TPA: hypothetical protein EYG09_01750 [Dehalococcoidia bacterium]|nr:hypothetical protein [Dehalococcoidia bacterium]